MEPRNRKTGRLNEAQGEDASGKREREAWFRADRPGGLIRRDDQRRRSAKEIDKPNSVPRSKPGGDHFSRPIVTDWLVRPTREYGGEPPLYPRKDHSLLGLAPAGGCLAGHITVPPVSSCLTFSPSPSDPCGSLWQSVSVVLLRALPRPDVIRQRALWSSDFPQTDQVRPRSPDALWRDHLNTANNYGQQPGSAITNNNLSGAV